MKEILTIDGKQYELTAEFPLTEQQRQQTISDIIKQSECSYCNKTQSLLNGTLESCIDVTVVAPATTIKSVTVGMPDMLPDTCISGTCNPITCSAPDCTDITVDIIITFENSGDVDTYVIPAIRVRESPTLVQGTRTTVPAATVTGTPPVMTPGSTSATFSGVVLTEGSNNVCASFTIVPY